MDLTVIYLTLNRMPESWAKFHMDSLLLAVKDYPVISISKVPMNLGTNILDTEEPSYVNIYRQILRGAKLATTKYIAIAEDDTLYHESNFSNFRPKDNEFAYNRCRWSVFSWGEPMYSLRRRISNCGCVAPRELMIEALTERFDKCGYDIPPTKCGECGRNKLEQMLGITLRKQVDFYSKIPIVQLSHPSGSEARQTIKRKSHAEVRAFDIPHWGRAEKIVKIYMEGN